MNTIQFLSAKPLLALLILLSLRALPGARAGASSSTSMATSPPSSVVKTAIRCMTPPAVESAVR